MRIRLEVLPYIVCIVLSETILWFSLMNRYPSTAALSVFGASVLSAFFIWFFRDPERQPPSDDQLLVSAADGRVHSISILAPDVFLSLCLRSQLTAAQIADMTRLCRSHVTRISVFLGLFDVHVNRAPMHGRYRFLGYAPGRRLFTSSDKSSTENQHNTIWAVNERTECLLFQIVGPFVRRVVYWHSQISDTCLMRGRRIGMMKFGSRLDIYLPSNDIDIICQVGDRVRAGETPLARIKAPPARRPEPT